LEILETLLIYPLFDADLVIARGMCNASDQRNREVITFLGQRALDIPNCSSGALETMMRAAATVGDLELVQALLPRLTSDMEISSAVSDAVEGRHAECALELWLWGKARGQDADLTGWRLAFMEEALARLEARQAQEHLQERTPRVCGNASARPAVRL
jgi:hypothetical protein